MVEGWVNSADQTTTARFFDMLTRALTIPGKPLKPRSTVPEQAAQRKPSSNKLDSTKGCASSPTVWLKRIHCSGVSNMLQAGLACGSSLCVSLNKCDSMKCLGLFAVAMTGCLRPMRGAFEPCHYILKIRLSPPW